MHAQSYQLSCFCDIQRGSSAGYHHLGLERKLIVSRLACDMSIGEQLCKRCLSATPIGCVAHRITHTAQPRRQEKRPRSSVPTLYRLQLMLCSCGAVNAIRAFHACHMSGLHYMSSCSTFQPVQDISFYMDSACRLRMRDL